MTLHPLYRCLLVASGSLPLALACSPDSVNFSDDALPGAGSGGTRAVGSDSSVSNGGGAAATGSSHAGGTLGSGGTKGSGAPGVSGTPEEGGSAGEADEPSNAGAPPGAGVPGKLCSSPFVVTAPLLTDFESYDGVSPALGPGGWGFAIGSTTAGLFALSEGSPPAASNVSETYSLDLAAGANTSHWAARARNPSTLGWGGGVGVRLGCVDASSFTGLSFWLRGFSPTGMMTVSLDTESSTLPDAEDPRTGGTCTVTPAVDCKAAEASAPITDTWAHITLTWEQFKPGFGGAGEPLPVTGEKLVAIRFAAGMRYKKHGEGPGSPVVAEPGGFEIAVDDLGLQ